MPFSGLSSNRLFTPNAIGEDISPIIATLAPVEAPFLDWLGDSGAVAMSTKHEYFMDYLRPHYIIASTAINSATAATAFQVNGLGESLVVGTLLENEGATPEVYQVASIVGPNSIAVTRNYDGSGVGSLAAGGQLYVRGPAGVEGQDHQGQHTARPGSRQANTVGLFNIPVAVSGTQLAIARNILGQETYDEAVAKAFRQVPSDLEKEVLRGVLNSTNSLGTSSATRTMKGIRSFITAVNSQVTASSFAANPHKYIGDTWEQAYQNGASDAETWAIVAGRTFFRNISDLNDSKVQDSNASEQFKRVIRNYEGPFGRCTVFLSRVLPATELLIVPRERVKVVPLTGRSFAYQQLGLSGDNIKGQVVGEYTTEVHHPDAMARLRV
jgi:hypothetical protein